MSNDKEKMSLNDRLRETEIKKVIAETKRIELERKELEQKISRPWYKPTQPFRAVIQAVVAGLVIVPLVWFYFQQVAIPLSKKENYELIAENNSRQERLSKAEEQIREKQDGLNKLIKQNAIVSDSLIRATDMLGSVQKELVAKENQYLVRVTDLQKSYDDLSKKLNLSEQEKGKFIQMAQQLEAEVAIQQLLIDSLKSESTKIENPKMPIETGFGSKTVSRMPLRKTPRNNLSDKEVGDIIKEQGFYDRYKNRNGSGIINQYESKTIGSDKVVIDHTTGLTWQSSGSKEHLISTSVHNYIDKLNIEKYGGHNDWRLPTLEEAMSLMESVKNDSGLYINRVFDNAQKFIWTADKAVGSRAWIVHFYYGNCSYYRFIDFFYVRAVGGGQLQTQINFK